MSICACCYWIYGLIVGSLHLWNHGYKCQMKRHFTALLLPQSVCREIKWWCSTKHLLRGWKGKSRRKAFYNAHADTYEWKRFSKLSSMIVDLYNSTMTHITRNSHVSPLELSLCDCWSCGWLCPHCAVSERKCYETMTYSRHSVGLLWAVSMYMHVCMPTVHSSTLCFCFSLPCTEFSSFLYCGSSKKH